MGGLGEMASGRGAQSLLLQADAILGKMRAGAGRAQPIQARLEILSRLIQGVILSAIVSDGRERAEAAGRRTSLSWGC